MTRPAVHDDTIPAALDDRINAWLQEGTAIEGILETELKRHQQAIEELMGTKMRVADAIDQMRRVAHPERADPFRSP